MRRSAAFTVLGLFLCSAAGGTGHPVGVSPGNASKLALVEARCPTFSWGAVKDAKAYELIVYRFGEENEDAKPVLSQIISGSALGWTPSLDRCLERGGQYAWSIRAVVGRGASEWSAPSLFEVVVGPSTEEFEEALEIVRRHLAANAGADVPAGASATRLEAASESRAQLDAPIPTIVSEVVGTATLTVVGEVRTLDSSSEPRLWGRGRPNATVYNTNQDSPPDTCQNGSINFGLSLHYTGWDSAADACPAGTWVCRLDEIVPCDTDRPPTGIDGYRCDGTTFDQADDEVIGWTADGDPSSFIVRGFGEGNLGFANPACYTLPVWCCWE